MAPSARKIIGTVGYMGGIPTLCEPFAWSWGNMIQYNTEYLCAPGERMHYVRSTISYHAAARNGIVKEARGDFLLMLDTDHSFDPDIVARMWHRMEKYNLDVLSAFYLHRAPPHVPVIYKFSEDGKSFENIGDWDRTPGKTFIKVAGAGAGCLMVRRSVFKRIEQELKEEPFDIIHPFGEDLSFFMRLKKLGIDVFCDYTIECHHLSYAPLSLEDYNIDAVTISPHSHVS